MPPIDARTTAIAAGTLLLVALGVAGLAGLDAPNAPRPSPPSVNLSSTSLPASLSPAPPAPPARLVAPTATPGEPWAAADTNDVVARRYRESSNLRDFYRRASQAGGMANLWFAQTALLRCSEVIRGGMVGAEQQFASMDWPNDGAPARREAHRQWIAPCRGFEEQPLPPGEILRNLRHLRETPGLVGDRYRLIAKGEIDPEEWRSHLRAVVESNDPYVIAAFGGDLANLRVGPSTYVVGPAAQPSGRNLLEEQTAWTLAGCSLGADCAMGSLAWWSACAASGDCGEGNALAGASAEVGSAAMPRVLRRRDEILAALRERDWTALGL